jgi:hypothetical protein
MSSTQIIMLFHLDKKQEEHVEEKEVVKINSHTQKSHTQKIRNLYN